MHIFLRFNAVLRSSMVGPVSLFAEHTHSSSPLTAKNWKREAIRIPREIPSELCWLVELLLSLPAIYPLVLCVRVVSPSPLYSSSLLSANEHAIYRRCCCVSATQFHNSLFALHVCLHCMYKCFGSVCRAINAADKPKPLPLPPHIVVVPRGHRTCRPTQRMIYGKISAPFY